ncbi:MAG: hypothetical protein Q8861_15135 [Bacteroidota bacterium]|nr:hypothetical protein [Bacteroidota bacterium]
MRKILYISIFLTAVCPIVFSGQVNKTPQQLIDITIFNTQEKKNWIFPKDYQLFQLNQSEISECERILKIFINQYNIKGKAKLDSLKKRYNTPKYQHIQFFKNQFYIDLKKYGRQYIAVKDKHSHTIVYINCFCNPSEFSYRKQEWVQVEDGGNCFFQIKIDLNDKKVIDFKENGVA